MVKAEFGYSEGVVMSLLNSDDTPPTVVYNNGYNFIQICHITFSNSDTKEY